MAQSFHPGTLPLSRADVRFCKLLSSSELDPPDKSPLERNLLPSNRGKSVRLHGYQLFRAFAAILGTALLVLFVSPELIGGQGKPPDLTELNIETLMNMNVSSASKKAQKLSHTAAAIYVISQTDIRRSGFNSVPELLRMVPGLDVARINSTEWAISSRGFNSRRAKKLLVLIDGRSLYWPAFGNVYWDTLNLMLEDIERIEVIRGPGATLWGTNAVNGVINVVTKSSQHTQGGLLSGGAGIQEPGFAAARFGGRLGSKGYYRVYGHGFDRSDLATSNGTGLDDDWRELRGGFRTDWELSRRDTLTVQGDLYRGAQKQGYDFVSLTPPFSSSGSLHNELHGGNLLSRWQRTYSRQSALSFQMYYDNDARDSLATSLFAQTAGVDFQHRLPLGERHDLLWGSGFRYVSDSVHKTAHESFLPATETQSLYYAFVEDELTLVRDRVHVTAGIRFGVSPYTGYHTEPNARLVWTPSEKQTIWFSVASAKPTPTRSSRESRVETSVTAGSDGTPLVRTRFGSRKVGDEDVLGLGLGYRSQLNHQISLDLATFYNRYKDLDTLEPGASFAEQTPAPAHIIVPRYYANLMDGKSYGGEIAVGWKVSNDWKLNASYSFLRLELKRDPTSLADNPERAKGDVPRHQAQFRSQWNLSRKFEFDQSLYSVGPLVAQSVPAYTRLDVRVGWRLAERIEVSVVGQNLFSPRHLEFARTSGGIASPDARKAYVKFTWKF